MDTSTATLAPNPVQSQISTTLSYMMPTLLPVSCTNPIPTLVNLLNLPSSQDVHFFTLQPLAEEDLSQAMLSGANIGFKLISQQEMNLKKVLGYLEENKQLKVQTERLKDTLLTLHKEYKKFMEDPSLLKYVLY